MGATKNLAKTKMKIFFFPLFPLSVGIYRAETGLSLSSESGVPLLGLNSRTIKHSKLLSIVKLIRTIS